MKAAIFLSLCAGTIVLAGFTAARVYSINLKRRDKILFVGGPLLIFVFVAASFYCFGFRFNFTSSMPKGVYMLQASQKTLERGDLTVFCLESENPYSALAKERGYLGPGSCPNGLRPLLKRLAGLPGDRVEITAEGLRVNNLLLAHTRRPDHDSRGRPLPPSLLRAGMIPDGLALLVSQEHDRSFDSRHFGLVPISILQKTEPVLTMKER